MYAFTLILAICLPILSMAETVVKIDGEDIITANEFENIITESDIEEAITFSLFFGKPKHYKKVWEFVNNDDRDGLRTYHDRESLFGDIGDDDFVVVWKFGPRIYAEHIFCYAARENKMKAGEMLIGLHQMKENCAVGSGYRKNVKYNPKKYDFWSVTHVQELNPQLACKALRQWKYGFNWDPQKDYALAAKGGCEDVYIAYRHKKLKFPRDYSILTTGKGWLQLARVQSKLVSDERFQKHLHDYYYNVSADDEATQKELKKLLIEK